MYELEIALVIIGDLLLAGLLVAIYWYFESKNPTFTYQGKVYSKEALHKYTPKKRNEV